MKRSVLALIFAGLGSSLIHIGMLIVFGLPISPWPVEVLSDPRMSFAEEARRAIFYSSNLSRERSSMVIVVGASAGADLQPGFFARTNLGPRLRRFGSRGGHDSRAFAAQARRRGRTGRERLGSGLSTRGLRRPQSRRSSRRQVRLWSLMPVCPEPV